MNSEEAKLVVIELSRKLFILKGERHKNIRNEMIDFILDDKDGEIPSIFKFIKEVGKR